MSETSLHTVLVPGLSCSARLYDGVYTDIWGYGPVSFADTQRDATIPAIAARALHNAPDRFALVGLSMGGYVALEMVRQAPERVVALALISTTARADTRELRASRQQQLDMVERGEFDRLIDAAFPALVAPANAERSDIRAFWQTMATETGPRTFQSQVRATMERDDLSDLLPSIACLTAVIHGADDQLIPVENAHHTAAGIAGAVETIIQGGGHMLPQEQPQALRQALTQWLDVAAGATAP